MLTRLRRGSSRSPGRRASAWSTPGVPRIRIGIKRWRHRGRGCQNHGRPTERCRRSSSGIPAIRGPPRHGSSPHPREGQSRLPWSRAPRHRMKAICCAMTCEARQDWRCMAQRRHSGLARRGPPAPFTLGHFERADAAAGGCLTPHPSRSAPTSFDPLSATPPPADQTRANRSVSRATQAAPQSPRIPKTSDFSQEMRQASRSCNRDSRVRRQKTEDRRTRRPEDRRRTGQGSLAAGGCKHEPDAFRQQSPVHDGLGTVFRELECELRPSTSDRGRFMNRLENRASGAVERETERKCASGSQQRWTDRRHDSTSQQKLQIKPK
jgi:hypothetical protein